MDEVKSSHQAWLKSFAATHGSMLGSVHVRCGEDLDLVAPLIPPPEQPVQTCNRQTDDSSRIKPGAQGVVARAAVVLPMFDPVCEVRVVVELAFHEEGVLAAVFERDLLDSAASLPASGC